MRRIACVNIQELPVQVALIKRPDWRRLPVVLVDQDKPHGVVVFLNKIAVDIGIRRGMTFSSAVSLVEHLKVDVVNEKEIDDELKTLSETLLRFSPEVETCWKIPGIFWLNASGMERIYASLIDWSYALNGYLAKSGYAANIAVGYSRFAVYAISRSVPGVTLLKTPDAEKYKLKKISVQYLDIPENVREILNRLGIQTVDQLLELPAYEVINRFGKDAYDIVTRLRNNTCESLRPDSEKESISEHVILDHPLFNSRYFLPVINKMLVEIRSKITKRHEKITSIELLLKLDSGEVISKSISISEPTEDVSLISKLISLYVDSLLLPTGIVEITIVGFGKNIHPEQPELIQSQHIGITIKAEEALDLIRSEYGEDAISKVQPLDGYLPEECFKWARFEKIRTPKPALSAESTLIRNFLLKPSPVKIVEMSGSGNRIFIGESRFVISRLSGPQLISGGWWSNKFDRSYYFIDSAKGDLLWVYYDHFIQQWFLQGKIA